MALQGIDGLVVVNVAMNDRGGNGTMVSLMRVQNKSRMSRAELEVTTIFKKEIDKSTL